MTIRRESGGTITVVCDNCGQLHQNAQWQPYKVAWQKAQEKGWVARAVGKDWQHVCPECALLESSVT